jgi:hypothetical protein
MIRSFTVLFSILLLASMVYAQNAPEAPAGYPAELTQGTSFTGFQWTPGVDNFNGKLAAIVPTYNGETGIGQMSLYGIKYGYFIATAWAVGGVLDFGSNSSTQDLTGGGQNKFSSTEFGITAFVNRYFQPKFEDVSVWVGAEISFGSLSSTQETTGTNPSKTELSASSLGIGLNFGAQYFIDKGFSLSADYHLGFLNFNKPEQTVTEGNTSVTTKGPSASWFGTMTGSLGINFYF